MWHPCPGFHLARPAGYHSGHVSACSSNEKCLTVNEINTDIRLAQRELRGKERVREKKRSGLAGEAEAAREREQKERGRGCRARRERRCEREVEEYEIFRAKGSVNFLKARRRDSL